MLAKKCEQNTGMVVEEEKCNNVETVGEFTYLYDIVKVLRLLCLPEQDFGGLSLGNFYIGRGLL